MRPSASVMVTLDRPADRVVFLDGGDDAVHDGEDGLHLLAVDNRVGAAVTDVLTRRRRCDERLAEHGEGDRTEGGETQWQFRRDTGEEPELRRQQRQPVAERGAGDELQHVEPAHLVLTNGESVAGPRLGDLIHQHGIRDSQWVVPDHRHHRHVALPVPQDGVHVGERPLVLDLGRRQIRHWGSPCSCSTSSRCTGNAPEAPPRFLGIV